MPNLNKIASDTTALRAKILGDINTLLRMYGALESEVGLRFREEHSKNAGRMEGLEDFYMLNQIVKKNLISVKQAYSIVHRMKDISGYDITEEIEEVKEAREEKEIKELLRAGEAKEARENKEIEELLKG